MNRVNNDRICTDALGVISNFDSDFVCNSQLQGICKTWQRSVDKRAVAQWTSLCTKATRQAHPVLYPLIQKIETKYKHLTPSQKFERLHKKMIKEKELCLGGSFYYYPKERKGISWYYKAETEIQNANRRLLKSINERLNPVSFRTFWGDNLPREIGQFKNLESIYYTHVDYRIRKEVGDLPSLKILDITSEKQPIRKLPKNLSKLFKNRDFKLIVNKDQFLRFQHQIEGMCPRPPLWSRAVNSIFYLASRLIRILPLIALFGALAAVVLDLFTLYLISLLFLLCNLLLNIKLRPTKVLSADEIRRTHLYNHQTIFITCSTRLAWTHWALGNARKYEIH